MNYLDKSFDGVWSGACFILICLGKFYVKYVLAELNPSSNDTVKNLYIRADIVQLAALLSHPFGIGGKRAARIQARAQYLRLAEGIKAVGHRSDWRFDYCNGTHPFRASSFNNNITEKGA